MSVSFDLLQGRAGGFIFKTNQLWGASPSTIIWRGTMGKRDGDTKMWKSMKKKNIYKKFKDEIASGKLDGNVSGENEGLDVVRKPTIP